MRVLKMKCTDDGECCTHVRRADEKVWHWQDKTEPKWKKEREIETEKEGE